MGKPRKIQERKVTCPDCGALMTLKRSEQYGLFYGCSTFPECRATHGAHPDGRPLGIPANKETKEWRIRAHNAFEKLWGLSDGKGNIRFSMDTPKNRKQYRELRGRAYRWLQKQLRMTSRQCHIGEFDIATCKRVIEACEQKAK